MISSGTDLLSSLASASWCTALTRSSCLPAAAASLYSIATRIHQQRLKLPATMGITPLKRIAKDLFISNGRMVRDGSLCTIRHTLMRRSPTMPAAYRRNSCIMSVTKQRQFCRETQFSRMLLGLSFGFEQSYDSVNTQQYKDVYNTSGTFKETLSTCVCR